MSTGPDKAAVIKILEEEMSEALRMDHRFLEDASDALGISINQVIDSLAGDEPIVTIKSKYLDRLFQ